MRVFLGLAALGCFLPFVSNAEVLAVCGTQQTKNAALYGAQTLGPSGPQQLATPEMTSLALWRDANGFDLIIGWGRNDQISLRAEGAEIMGNEMGPDFVHIIVARARSHGFEHFIFSFDPDMDGRLIWTGSDKLASPGEPMSFETACRKSAS